MTYLAFCITIITVLAALFLVSTRAVSNDEHPVPIILFILLLISTAGSFFAEKFMFDFDEPICIKHVGYVETVYSWKHQEKTFNHDGETHRISELLDYDQINIDSIPDSVMVFQYVYEDFGPIIPSREFFVYSEKPTNYTTEGACVTTAETK